MYWRFILKEREQGRMLFSLIALQLVVVFIIGISCISVFCEQYRNFSAFTDLISGDGWFIHSNFGVEVPEDEENMITGKEFLEQKLSGTELICTYRIFGDFGKGKRYLEFNGTVYDEKIVDCISPQMAEGRWLGTGENNEKGIDAVISENYYGLEIGDNIQLTVFDAGGDEIQVPVTIVGRLKENEKIARFDYSENMVTSQNFMKRLSVEEGDMPVIILEENENLHKLREWEDIKYSFVPNGLLFFKYNRSLTEEERKENEEVLQNNVEIAIKEALPTVAEKSKEAFGEQALNLLPIFLAVLIIALMSTWCVSVLLVKKQSRKIAVYRILGMTKQECLKLQMLVNGTVLMETVLAAGVAFFLINHFDKEHKFILDFGVWQLLGCACIALSWWGLTFLIQKKMFKEPELWRLDSL